MTVKFGKDAQRELRLKTTLKARQEEITVLLGQNESNNKKMVDLRLEIERIKSALQEMQPKELQITDHARVRFIERVYGIDMSDVDKDILDQKKHKIKVRNNKVVTVLLEEEEER